MEPAHQLVPDLGVIEFWDWFTMKTPQLADCCRVEVDTKADLSNDAGLH